ncbi:MAG: DNA integrity scanning protein DisA nucleotide-binding domain protein, partial [Bacteroidota bacterium]|nr:DNA integrity scanning protein DisA nucleotide-binding domain protein [Bacteroidota bacterium]
MVFYKSFRWTQVLPWNWRTSQPSEINFDELARACKRLSQTHTGATIVLARSSELKFFASTGIAIEGELTAKLFETIFMNKSPLHDGAVIVVKNRIKAASCILPVSENPNLPFEFGLRHRSALGISEQTDAIAVVCSEETGRITLASKGDYSEDLSLHTNLARRLFEEYYELPQKTRMPVA